MRDSFDVAGMNGESGIGDPEQRRVYHQRQQRTYQGHGRKEQDTPVHVERRDDDHRAHNPGAGAGEIMEIEAACRAQISSQKLGAEAGRDRSSR